MFIIAYGNLGYVYKFTNSHGGMVRFCDNKIAKRFKTAQKAQDFIDTYSGCGYGLDEKYCTIIPA